MKHLISISLIALCLTAHAEMREVGVARTLAPREVYLDTNGNLPTMDADLFDDCKMWHAMSTNNHYDLSAESYDGTGHGATWTNVYGGCYYFDGVNDYIGYDSAVIPDGHTGGWSVGVWFKAPAGYTRRMILETPLYYSISFELKTDDTVRLFFNGGGANNSWSDISGVYDDDTWYFILGVFDPSDRKMRAYMDGVLKSTGLASGVTTLANSTGLHVGTYRNADDRWFKGFIDDVMIFDRAVTSNEQYNIFMDEPTIANGGKR